MAACSDTSMAGCTLQDVHSMANHDGNVTDQMREAERSRARSQGALAAAAVPQCPTRGGPF